MCRHVYVCVYIHIYVCVYIYIYIYIYIIYLYLYVNLCIHIERAQDGEHPCDKGGAQDKAEIHEPSFPLEKAQVSPVFEQMKRSKARTAAAKEGDGCGQGHCYIHESGRDK